jgi:hypothetical protein
VVIFGRAGSCRGLIIVTWGFGGFDEIVTFFERKFGWRAPEAE